MERIYCISGLGADHRFFEKLIIENYELVPVHWEPYNLKDDLPKYAQTLATQIRDKNPIIIGLSFGGMLAVEIAKKIPVRKVFIVSSVKNSSELNIPGGSISRWIINRMILPTKLLTIPNFIVLHYLGAKTKYEKQLLKQIIRDSDGRFMKWALKAIITWQNNTCPKNVTHIHGTADKVIPSAYVHPDFWIEGGTHTMIYNRAAEVSKIISECLAR